MATFFGLIAFAAVLYIFLRGNQRNTRGGASSPNVDYLPPRSVDEGFDAWEGSFWEAVETKPVAARLHINYVDGNGKKTRRNIRVRQFGLLEQRGILIAHCELRGDTRTFRFDRVGACVDTDTGEVINDISHFLTDRHAKSPDRALEKMQETEGDTLKILFYLGKADGQFKAEERAIVRETVHALVADSRLNDHMIDDVLKNLGMPSLQGFKLAVGRMAKQAPDRRAAILDASRRMVGTQKTVAPAEAEAIAYIEKRLSSS